MILNMNQLRTFYFAAKTKSVTKAAQELMVTPPAVSMQIKQLEETLGIRLVFREGNAINLTEIGISVFSKAGKFYRRHIHSQIGRSKNRLYPNTSQVHNAALNSHV